VIGWRPLLFTALAAVLLAAVALDASEGFHAAAYATGPAVPTWLHNALNAGVDWIKHLGVLDWILVGTSVYLLAWGWVRALAFARLGTIQIADLTCDDDGLGPTAGKALLQQALGERGLLPPSGVPGGSPTVANIADAISKAPVPQASWLGALLGLIPTPPSSTGFMIAGTLLQTPGQGQSTVQFAYELTCTGPRPSVNLGAATAPDAGKAIVRASREIYRTIGVASPNIYPSWARWCTSDALTTYYEGLGAEQEGSDYATAYVRYLAASELDPDNMLSRLRAANCVERMAAGTHDRLERFALRVQALAAYNSIRVRWPEIFEAGFRASVLMSVLSSEPETVLESDPLLPATLDRYERANAKVIDPHDSPEPPDNPPAQPAADPSPKQLCDRLQDAALQEAGRVRRQLRPLWTLRHYKRFRHRFEPTGRERRQLRKALAVSKMAQKARSERTRLVGRPAAGQRPVSPQRRVELLDTARIDWGSNLRQMGWRALVRGWYLGARWHVAGWQAHYNAACFYALLPLAERWSTDPRGAKLRDRALEHLRFALDQADDALDCVYVRDEDPDLDTLRRHSRQRFSAVLGRVCQDELVVHYQTPQDGSTWKLRAWGDAVSTDGDGYAYFSSIRSGDGETTFRVRIFDENRPLRFQAWCDGQAAGEDPGWELIPATLVTQEISVHPSTSMVLDAQKKAVGAQPLG
jgi:hypothetical protein